MSTARHGTQGNTIKGLKNGTPEWWRCPKTLVTSPLWWQKYSNDNLRTETQLTAMFHCRKMIQQGLLQLLLQFHPCPQRNFTSGTNQGFQNAKLIYFRQNNELDRQYLHFSDATYIFLRMQKMALCNGFMSLPLWSNFRIWIRFLERWIIYISLIFKKTFKCKPTNSNYDISMFVLPCYTRGLSLSVCHTDY